MKRIFGLALATGIVLTGASSAKAQIGMTFGSPYTNGLVIGTGGYVSPFYAPPVYAPAPLYYGTGYRTWGVPTYGYRTTGFRAPIVRPNYGYAPFAGARYYGGGRGIYRNGWGTRGGVRGWRR